MNIGRTSGTRKVILDAPVIEAEDLVRANLIAVAAGTLRFIGWILLATLWIGAAFTAFVAGMMKGARAGRRRPGWL